MQMLALLLCLLAAPLGVLSQLTLQESGPGLVKPSQTLSLTCIISGGELSSSYYWYWIRHHPRKGLEELGFWTWKTSYNPAFEGRISITADTSMNKYYLQLTSMDVEDTATYYCARSYYYSGYFDFWSQGSKVTVTSESPSSPTLFPFVSCESAVSQDSLVAIVCLAQDFLPSSITFSWNYKNSTNVNSQNIMTFPSVLRDGKYMASSQLLLPAMNIVPGTDEYLVCKVEHTNGNTTLTMSLSDLMPPELSPSVAVYIPPQDAFSSSSQYMSKLICQATHFSPKQISLSWLQDGKLLETGFSLGEAEPEAKDSGTATYKVTSTLIISESDWLNQKVFTCRVQHNGLTFLRNVSSLFGANSGTSSGIKIFPIHPSFASTYITKSAKLSCMVTDLTTHDSLSISWIRENGEVLKTHTNISRGFPNGTFSALGQATVCTEEWEMGVPFTCIVTHKDLPSPLKRTISKPKGATKHMPAVYLLPPTRDQLSLEESASLTCLVKGFSPPDVFVQWLHKGQPVPTHKYMTSAPMLEPQSGSLYFTYSLLTISEKDWSDGDSYTCIVGHEALPHIVTERTIDKSTGKPSLYNVSLVMSDMANTCY